MNALVRTLGNSSNNCCKGWFTLSRVRLLAFTPTKATMATVANTTTKSTSGSVGTTAKDIVLFKHEGEKFYKLLTAFSVAQLGFWGFLSYSTLSLKYAPPRLENYDELPFWRKFNLGEDKVKKVLAGVYAAIGYLIMAGCWVYTKRSVRYVILRKDGATVALVTYHPTGRNAVMNVPLSCISAMGSRTSNQSSIPLKVKDRKFFYLIDASKGVFPRPELFDRTVGIKRKL